MSGTAAGSGTARRSQCGAHRRNATRRVSGRWAADRVRPVLTSSGRPTCVGRELSPAGRREARERHECRPVDCHEVRQFMLAGGVLLGVTARVLRGGRLGVGRDGLRDGDARRPYRWACERGEKKRHGRDRGHPSHPCGHGGHASGAVRQLGHHVSTDEWGGSHTASSTTLLTSLWVHNAARVAAGAYLAGKQANIAGGRGRLGDTWWPPSGRGWKRSWKPPRA